jgi:hypothetical protein
MQLRISASLHCAFEICGEEARVGAMGMRGRVCVCMVVWAGRVGRCGGRGSGEERGRQREKS